MKTIEITIAPDGKTTVQSKGFSGQSCRDATRSLIDSLGLAQVDQPTAEYYAQQEVNNQRTQTSS
jgi:hypothetical protein